MAPNLGDIGEKRKVRWEYLLTDSMHNIEHHLEELVKIGKQLTSPSWVVPADFDITKYLEVVATGQVVVRIAHTEKAEWGNLKIAIRSLSAALDQLKESLEKREPGDNIQP